jgi:hypothetical protein
MLRQIRRTIFTQSFQLVSHIFVDTLKGSWHLGLTTRRIINIVIEQCNRFVYVQFQDLQATGKKRPRGAKELWAIMWANTKRDILLFVDIK